MNNWFDFSYEDKDIFRNYPADAKSAFGTEVFTVLDESLVV